ncbi:hypothetical protein F3Y22_tig00116989pilonHSYRG00700 [Hibiscus syriacus]|uniref:ABC transmembrane type-1 domain-containing protein n=1 Tax=Hibiscus syriacus TaxID=106335 RepID=A0A6A2X6H6_HIBSY|nr:hypothetical protein F3Y22_tig00116989pilonHSYRG00700 [Hibiscus syriacus]
MGSELIYRGHESQSGATPGLRPHWHCYCHSGFHRFPKTHVLLATFLTTTLSTRSLIHLLLPRRNPEQILPLAPTWLPIFQPGRQDSVGSKMEREVVGRGANLNAAFIRRSRSCTCQGHSTGWRGHCQCKIVVAFNSKNKIVGLFSLSLQTHLKRCFWKGQIAGSGFGVAQFALYASYALGLWFASWLVKHGISDFSKTIRVFMVLMVSANSAAETSTLAPDFIKGGQTMKSGFDLLERKTEIKPDATQVPDRLRGEVELKIFLPFTS